jgi:hypothetical protein
MIQSLLLPLPANFAMSFHSYLHQQLHFMEATMLQQKPSKEELQWMRSGPQPDGEPVDMELIESAIAKELVVRNPDGSLKLTDTGFKYMIGGC